MASENETVEDVLREMRERENLDGGERVDNFNIDLGEYGEFDGLKLIKAYADAIESAWRRERAELERKVSEALYDILRVAENRLPSQPTLDEIEAVAKAKAALAKASGESEVEK